MEKKYFEVACVCGHVGRNNYIVKEFGVIADSKKSAAKKARLFPRVKHDRKNAVISVKEKSQDEYNALIEKNNNDRYFKCKNIQEQRMLCHDIYNEIKRDYEDIDEYEIRDKRNERIILMRKKQKSFGDAWDREGQFQMIK